MANWLDMGQTRNSLEGAWRSSYQERRLFTVRRDTQHCCKRDPMFVDMTTHTPPAQQIEDCCNSDVIKSWLQDPGNALSAFQLKVGHAGTNKRRVRKPKSFSLKAPRFAYMCRYAKKVVPNKKAMSKLQTVIKLIGCILFFLY